MDRKTEHEAMAEEADLESAGRTDAFAAPSARGVAPAGMFRRMAALLYDSLVMMAVLMVATTPFLPFLDGRVLRPEEVGPLAYAYWAWQAAVIAVFFGFFWTRRGQTLGMQAWRLRVEHESGRRLGWRGALLRQAYAVAPWLPGFLVLSYSEAGRGRGLQLVGDALLLLGVLDWTMMWFDARRLTWHDRMSRSRIVVLPRKLDPHPW